MSEGTVVLDPPAVLGVVDKDGKLMDRKMLLLLSGLAFSAATIKLLDAVRSWQPAIDGRKVDWAFRLQPHCQVVRFGDARKCLF